MYRLPPGHIRTEETVEEEADGKDVVGVQEEEEEEQEQEQEQEEEEEESLFKADAVN